MGSHEEAALRVGALERARQLGERGVDLVVGVRDASRPRTEPEMQENRRHVVGEHSVPLTHVAQRMPNDHVREQRERRVRALAGDHEPAVEPRVVEEGIDALFAEGHLRLFDDVARAARDQPESQLRVIAR